MINVQGVSKYFGQVKAVDTISFEVKEGENLILLGTSGCGKTTTLKMINRLIEPTSGSINVNGVDVTKQSPEILRRGIGYILQHNSLFPHYTVAENIAVVPHLLQWDKNKIRSRTEELLHKLNLPLDKLSVYPHELSGGQQQRVNIARAIAADPPVLLMDEPFGALDAITRVAIARDFRELDEFRRKTIVMVTHDIQEAFLLGDRICLMRHGKIEQCGKPLELLFHPANDFVEKFLSASYLQLVLRIIKIQDIWDKLTSANAVGANQVDITGNESLGYAMELAIKSDAQTINVQNAKGQIKTVNREDIFRAGAAFTPLQKEQ